MLRLTDNELVWIIVTLKLDISSRTDWNDYILNQTEVYRIVDKLNEELTRLVERR